MTHRDTTPTIVPPADPELSLFERVAAAHADESPWRHWRRVCDRVEIARARVELRRRYAGRSNMAALYEQCAQLPPVVRSVSDAGEIEWRPAP